VFCELLSVFRELIFKHREGLSRSRLPSHERLRELAKGGGINLFNPLAKADTLAPANDRRNSESKSAPDL
jgi:hypothetical protein